MSKETKPGSYLLLVKKGREVSAVSCVREDVGKVAFETTKGTNATLPKSSNVLAVSPSGAMRMYYRTYSGGVAFKELKHGHVWHREYIDPPKPKEKGDATDVS